MYDSTHVEARGQPQMSAVPFVLVHCCVLWASWPASFWGLFCPLSPPPSWRRRADALVAQYSPGFSSVLWVHTPGPIVHGDCSIHRPIFPACLLKYSFPLHWVLRCLPSIYCLKWFSSSGGPVPFPNMRWLLETFFDCPNLGEKMMVGSGRAPVGWGVLLF